MLNVNANSLGMQYHKLIEKSLGAPSNMTYSLNNIVPTPIRVHTQISAVHSSKIAGPGSNILRTHIQSLKLPWEKVYEIEARIWQRGMQLDGAPIPMKDVLNIINNI